jgi:2-hydroxychromene-2-carboxylate isomerase
MPSDEQVIEYFYSAHSAYAYLGAWELDRIARESGWRVAHRPFDFWPVVSAAGGPPLKDRTGAHVGYFFGREMKRWAEWRELPMISHRPTFHDAPLALPNGLIVAAGEKADALSRAILQAHWRDDADISDLATLAALAEAEGFEADPLLERARSAEVRAQLEENIQEAIARNVFGSPTYFVRGDMFYGQDRLEMVARAIERPFAA